MKKMRLLPFATAAFLVLVAPSGFAQGYPDRPVRVIVPFSAGGGTDTVTRTVLRKVSESMGQPFIVDNKPGASGLLGLAELARAKPDGYTLGGSGSGLDLNPVGSARPFPELDAVAPLASSPMALIASNGTPGKTASEIFSLAKSHPESPLSFGSPGVATPHHLAGVRMAASQDVALTHVPYRGTALVLQDVAGNQISLGFVGLAGALPFAQGGKFRLLGVLAPQRSSIAPDVPTLAEAGIKGFDATYWFDISAPKGLAKPVMDRLRAEIVKALQDPEVRESLRKGGFVPMIMTPAEYARSMTLYTATWSEVMRKYNIRSTD